MSDHDGARGSSAIEIGSTFCTTAREIFFGTTLHRFLCVRALRVWHAEFLFAPPERVVSLPELHLSKPGVTLPTTRVDNAEVLRRVRAQFKGTADEFAGIASAIERVFGLCRTQVFHGVEGANQCCHHGAAAMQVELDGVLARFAAWRRKPQHQRIVDRLAARPAT